jgi:hypothetical protein
VSHVSGERRDEAKAEMYLDVKLVEVLERETREDRQVETSWVSYP